MVQGTFSAVLSVAFFQPFLALFCLLGVICVLLGHTYAFYTPHRALTRRYSDFYGVVVSLIGLACSHAVIGRFPTLLLQHESEHFVDVDFAPLFSLGCFDCRI